MRTLTNTQPIKTVTDHPWKTVGIVALVVVGLLVAMEIPEIQRYIRIKRM